MMGMSHTTPLAILLAVRLPLSWNRSTYRLEIATYIEGDKLYPGTLSRIVTELVAIRTYMHARFL